ncbi:MAG: hypothetical protein ACJAR1_000249 [Rubritalea sp.]|jgi:hypothetical protein
MWVRMVYTFFLLKKWKYTILYTYYEIDTQNNLSKTMNTLNKITKLALGLTLIAGSANAAIVFTDDFESPDVTAIQSDGNTSGAITTSQWVKATNGFGSNRQGTVDESHGDFTDPVGEQAYAFRYTNSGITTTLGSIGTLMVNTTYTISFDIVTDGHNTGTAYTAGLVTFDGAGTRTSINGSVANSTASVLKTIGGNSTGTSYIPVSFSWTTGDAIASGTATLGHDVALRFVGATSTAIIDNVLIDVTSVPEPSSTALLGLGGLAFILRKRR